MYDSLGWNTFPVAIGEKAPTVAWRAFQTERTGKYLESWFGGLEESNLWVLCGRISGIVVVDCDTDAAVELVEALAGDTWRAKTANGKHFFFRYPQGKQRSWSYHKGEIGLDVRADGTGVVVPPSVHASGAHYVWEIPPRSDGEGLVDLPGALRGREAAGLGAGQDGHTKGLRWLLDNLPERGERNVWLTQVAGHYARRLRNDEQAYRRKVLAANAKLEPSLRKAEAEKTIESVWRAEQSKKEPGDTIGSGLKGDGDRLWLVRDDGEVAAWSNFDVDALAVTVDPETGKSWYQVALKRGAIGDVLMDSIDGATLGNSVALKRWLGDRRLAVSGKGGDPAMRLLVYLEEQQPPTKQMLPWLGWHEGLGFATFEGIITATEIRPHEGAVPIVKRDAAPFRYGFSRGTEAKDVLREVLTFHEPDVCAVFGAWWAACFLKAQIVRETALFPFIALEAASESGKTTGFFSLMMQLNGNYQGQGELTLASLRDRIAAHRNGIVWIDDMAEVDAVLDLIRQATMEGTKTKMAEGWARQKSVRLVAPVVLSGEYLGKLGHEKALLDRAVRLKVGSPIGRVSERGAYPQWDDIVELRTRYSGDLCDLAGTLVQDALAREGRVKEWLRKLRPGTGRVADKWAILRFGGRLLGAMAGQKEWPDRVDAWIETQEDLGSENDLTLQVLPGLLRWEDFPNSTMAREPGRSASVFLEDGVVWFNIPMAADQWKRMAQREYNPRTQSQAALEQQRIALGMTYRTRRDGPTHDVRLRYWMAPRDLSEKIVERAGAKQRRNHV